MQRVPLDREERVEVAAEQQLAQPGKPVGLVEVVAVHAEHPHGLADEWAYEDVGLARPADAVQAHLVREVVADRSQDPRCVVTRAVVDEDDLVAGVERVPDGSVDEDVLVAHHRDADQAGLAHRKNGAASTWTIAPCR